MEKVTKEMVEKGILKADQGALFIVLSELVPGPERKRLEKAVVR